VTTIRELMAAARRRGVERLDAQLLLGDVLGRDRSWLLAHDEAPLAPDQLRRLEALLARRLDGEPVAYLVGRKEFHGLTLQVDERVLVPRPDTEVLVDWALELLSGDMRALPRPDVVDLGTGSGAIALAVKAGCPRADVVATDVSTGAIEVARGNARRLALEVSFAQGSWWQAVPARRFHLALSNPPYIAAEDAHLKALHAEPRGALTPGESGLEAFDAIVGGSAAALAAGAWLLLEHGFDQADAVSSLLGRAGFRSISTRTDLAGRPRCTGGRR